MDKNYTRKEHAKEKTSPPKAQTSFIPNPQEEEETAMRPIFLQSSLPITISESDTTSCTYCNFAPKPFDGKFNFISTNFIYCEYIAHKIAI